MREFVSIILVAFNIGAVFADDTCNPGQYLNNGTCANCDFGSYCEGGTSSPKSCSEKTNHLFPNSDEGSDDITDCYTDGYAADGETTGCEDEDTGIDSSCKVHCLAQESDYTYINTYADAYEYGLSAKCDGDSLWNNYYHIEVYNEQPFCLGKKLACSKFNNTSGCDDDGAVTGTANYNNNTWNLVACHCEKSFSDPDNRHCDGKTIYNASPASITNFFDTVNFGGSSSYYCNKCENKYYVETTYTSGPGTCAKPEEASIVVCECEKIPKGYFGTQNCDWVNNADTLSDNPCPKHDCPNPGQTTLSDGATNENLCTYAPKDIPGQTPTQFCDAKGCFTLSSTDIDAWEFHP